MVEEKEQVESLQQSASLQAKGNFRKLFLIKSAFDYENILSFHILICEHIHIK